MAITAQTLQLVASLRSEVAAITDAQTRELVAAYARAWDEVSADLQAAVLDLASTATDQITRTQILRSSRLTKALNLIGEQLQGVADRAGVTLSKDIVTVVEQAGRAQAPIIASQLPLGQAGLAVTWDRVDPAAIESIVKRSTEQITARLWPLSSDATEVMRRELVRGLPSGSNPNETARRMIARTQGTFEGGAGRAVTIARTETLDAHRAATSAAMRANTETLTGWTWLASLGPRTCSGCWGMNGTEHDVSEPGPQDHQNGRCTAVPKTKTWAELGIDMDEPASLLPDSEQVFQALPVADQKAILGPGKHAAWAAGEFPMDKWAAKRSTDGWRDSWAPAKLPKPSAA